MQEYLREAPSIINDGAFYLALGDVRLNPVDLVESPRLAFCSSATVDMKASGYPSPVQKR